MEKFKISDIQEIFTSDVERFHTLTQQAVTQLLNETPPTQEALDEALRQCHTLKGLSATVQAWGLSCLGADLEKLLELAGSWMHNDREKANGIFEFILDHMQDWYVMNQFSCMDMLPQAWDVYQGLRGIMVERWPGCLPAPTSADGENAHYVRLQDLEIPELPSMAAVTEGVELARTAEPPTPDLDVKDVQPIAAVVQPSVPTPLRVVPPTLRQRIAPAESLPIQGPANAETPAENTDVQQGAPIAHLEQPAVPQPLRVVPPMLRQRDPATPPTPVENLNVPPVQPTTSPEPPGTAKLLPADSRGRRRRKKSRHAQQVRVARAGLPATENLAPPQLPVAPEPKVQAAIPPPAAPVLRSSTGSLVLDSRRTAEGGPPILRVAPPALKRRDTQSGLPTLPAVEAVATPTSPVPVEQLPVGPSATGSARVGDLHAEDVFAALTVSDETVTLEVSTLVDQVLASADPALETKPAATLAEVTTEVESQPAAEPDLLELLGQEIAGYLAELTTHLTALAVNLADVATWERVRRLFHTIKGTAGTFELEAVARPARAAERCCLGVMEAVAQPEVEFDSREAFETCVDRAQVVAQELALPFAVQPLQEALEAGLASLSVLAAADAGQTAEDGSQKAEDRGQKADADLRPPTSDLRSPTSDLPRHSETTAGAALDPEMAGFFIEDARAQIEAIEQAVLRWEKGEQPLEQVQAAQRGFHTIKGAGNSIGLTGVAQSVHEVEAFLEAVAPPPNHPDAESFLRAVGTKPLFTFLLGAVDQLRRYLTEMAQNPTAPWRHNWQAAIQLFSQPADGGQKSEVRSLKPEGVSPTSDLQAAIEEVVVQASLSVETAEAVEPDAGAESHYLRIEAARLYQVMNLIGEMVIDRARLARKIEQLTSLQRALAERNQALSGVVQSFQKEFEFNLLQTRGQGTRDAGQVTRDPKLVTPDTCPLSRPGKGEFSELEFDRYDQFNVLARSLVEISHDLDQLNADVAASLDSFSAENAQFTQTSQQLQSKVTGLSLVPVQSLFPRLQRAFRDALQVEQKEADLALVGGQTLLDKVLVDRVYAPLLHLVRNAVAHGVEDAATRQQCNKPARGQVRLSAMPLSNQIVIQLSDDGVGIDAEAVRRRAVERGWLPQPEAGVPAVELTPEQVVHFIFQPGFSTAARVTSVSGRGIGLDVVRQEIENLNGSVELKYSPGAGCTWTLRLPLTLSISEAILACVGPTLFAFPLNFIECGLILDEPSRWGVDGRELYLLRERVTPVAAGTEVEVGEVEPPAMVEVVLPVLRLSRLLRVPGLVESNKGLIVRVGERRAIVVVDVVLRRQEVVNKQLDSVTAQHPLLNGASLDAEGRVIPILNLPALLKFAEAQPAGSGQGAEGRAQMAEGGSLSSAVRPLASELLRVLIVDDSLSVRKVQERFLTELGCAVTAASDGLDALERLREAGSAGGTPFDFVFTDLEMPRLNGYELISEVRGNPAWSALPVVVVSSRGADKYVTKAMNLGATTFLTKPFSQEQLREVLKHYAPVAVKPHGATGEAGTAEAATALYAATGAAEVLRGTARTE